MNTVILSFTKAGAGWNRLLTERLPYPAAGYTFYKYPADGLTEFQSVEALLQELWPSANRILFISAAGIAVRAIAKLIQSKDRDPAVLVMDETGRSVISLLSGHLGGANEWCEQIASLTGARPVITTATDLNGRFAVDEFARRNVLRVLDVDRIKEISSRILDGIPVGIYSELPTEGTLPRGLVPYREEWKMREGPEAGISIAMTPDIRPFPITCRLIPADLAVGVGCRRGKDMESLASFLEDILSEYSLAKERIRLLASIDRKKEEEGIIQLAEWLGVSFETFSPEQLAEQPGVFPSSGFVEQTVGIGNVCERSAVLAANGGELICRKRAYNGMTAAIAAYRIHVSFTN